MQYCLDCLLVYVCTLVVFVECLLDQCVCVSYRIFSYDHLAQMKHIYPEAIEVKRVLKCDSETSCMKPTLHINLNTDAIELEDTSCGTKYMQLRNVFYSKLVDFYKAHPKVHILVFLCCSFLENAKRI